jgi:lipopolysaccharide biosynthesis protein
LAIPKYNIKRCAIFAHFDKNDTVDDYVFYYLKNLSKVSSDIIFVSTSNLSIGTIERLKGICTNVIIRKNIGYDFMSWRMGIKSIPDLDFYDDLIICNDSVYGPFSCLESIFDTMDQKKCHFWGLTESHAIAYHLQSYFVVFRKEILFSNQFREFWASVDQLDIKKQIIEEYEIGLTQTLLKANCKPGVYIHYKPTLWVFFKIICRSLRNKTPYQKFNNFLALFTLKLLFKQIQLTRRNYLNPTHFYWKELILFKNMPFLKIELLRDNPMHIDIEDYESVIKKCSDYNLDLIHNHLKRVK